MKGGKTINDALHKLVEGGILPEAWTIMLQEEFDEELAVSIVSSLPPEQTAHMLAHGAIQMSDLIKNEEKIKEMH